MPHEQSRDLANFRGENYTKQLQLSLEYIKIKKKRENPHTRKKKYWCQRSLPPNLCQYFSAGFVVWHVQPAKPPQEDLLRSGDRAGIPRQPLR